jgi:phosphatidylglycerophosphatase A
MTCEGTEMPARATFARLITSCFGLGRLPLAPGTWGSVPAAAAFGAMGYLGVSPWVISAVMLFLMLGASLVCVVFSPMVIESTGKKDPGEIVVDELAGQSLTFVAAPFLAAGAMTLSGAAVGFVAFRVFDVLKPWPCRRLEKLPAGFGIVADDLMAGLYAAIVLQAYTCF